MSSRSGGVPARSAGGNWPILVLVAGLVAAVPVLLSFGSGAWFNLDEWNFLADRELGDALDPYQGHLVAVPAVVFRASFRLWGLHSYAPYQILIVLVNVGTVALLWLVMRRLGVRRWIATGTALPVLLFGAGATNLLYAFQISLVGSLFCGLGHLLLADHDGPVGRRDFVGLGVGAIGLMCSGVAVSLVAGVGIAVLLRRGLRPALMHTVPLAAIYTVWFILAGSGSRPRDYHLSADSSFWPYEMARSTFVDLSQQPILGIALAVLAVLGLTSVVMDAQRERRPATLALPAGLLVSFVGFAWLTAVASPEGLSLEFAGIDRYVHIAAVLLLPFVGLGGAFLAKRESILGMLPIALLVAGLPANARLLDDYPNPIFQPRRELILAVAHSEFLDDAPDDLRIAANPYVPELGPTVRWLRSNVAAGLIPEPRRSTRLELTADGVLVLQQHDDADHEPGSCPRRDEPWTARLSGGDAIQFDGNITVFLVGGARSAPFPFDSENGSVIAIASGPVDVIVEGDGGLPPRVC